MGTTKEELVETPEMEGDDGGVPRVEEFLGERGADAGADRKWEGCVPIAGKGAMGVTELFLRFRLIFPVELVAFVDSPVIVGNGDCSSECL